MFSEPGRSSPQRLDASLRRDRGAALAVHRADSQIAGNGTARQTRDLFEQGPLVA
ncbi:MAG: hypothetical protein LBB66_10365 [Desulfovibrio sp.]|nr:hypothetical protein [Desulfovibrio sp.]